MIIYAFKSYYHFPIDLIWSILYNRLLAVKSIQAYGMTHAQRIYTLCVLASPEGGDVAPQACLTGS